MKNNIAELASSIEEARQRQSQANKDIKQIEKDMKEFSKNKDSKLAELQTSVTSLRNALDRNSASLKALQKELQVSRLESEQTGGDMIAAEEQLSDSRGTLKSLEEEMEALAHQQAEAQVRPSPDLLMHI